MSDVRKATWINGDGLGKKTLTLIIGKNRMQTAVYSLLCPNHQPPPEPSLLMN